LVFHDLRAGGRVVGAHAVVLPSTVTTIITFLLFALLQNTPSRADKAVQQKLNAPSPTRCGI
jgi:low affinity Fe/Cu permease